MLMLRLIPNVKLSTNNCETVKIISFDGFSSVLFSPDAAPLPPTGRQRGQKYLKFRPGPLPTIVLFSEFS